MQPDPITKSWRIGAILPMLIPLVTNLTGIGKGLEEPIMAAIHTSCVAVSGVMLVISKLREQIKTKQG
jgi:hypothetical protein